MKLIGRMKISISQRKGNIILTRDFKAIASKSYVNKCLRQLVEQGKLIRIGYGVYTKTKISQLSGEIRPCTVFEELAAEAFDRLGINYELGRAQKAYVEGRTTQIPVQETYDVGSRRITRKITVGGRNLRYENNRSS